MTGVLKLKDTGSLGKTGRGGGKGAFPPPGGKKIKKVKKNLKCTDLFLGMDEELRDIL